MELETAIDAFAALAQPTRLAALKLLVRAGPEGMPAGEIARLVAAPASTMSTHLAILHRAGLIASRRESRLIYYAANFEGVSELVSYLIEDCCQGRPEICTPVAATVERAACCSGASKFAKRVRKRRAA